MYFGPGDGLQFDGYPLPLYRLGSSSDYFPWLPRRTADVV
jgi:hypothetical protein